MPALRSNNMIKSTFPAMKPPDFYRSVSARLPVLFMLLKLLWAKIDLLPSLIFLSPFRLSLNVVLRWR